MAEGKTLAKAYVQMIPTTKGFKSALETGAGADVDSAGDSLGKRLGSMFKKAIVAAGIGKAIKTVIGGAVAEGAALEQSIGGIETLFGTAGNSLEEYAQIQGKSVDEVRAKYDSLARAQNTMYKYAQNAFKDAGLSANEYMEQATGFAASLVSSLGGDTEKAAEVANTALKDMSDNANKMGTDAESLQMAYQGFAKQNYTMLDNLKLGYGGTKEEMERLLADASKLSGVEYNIDNLADVYNAIHTIQENLQITGTTAKEAATTFSGSLQMVKGAYKNVLGYLANGQDNEAMEALNGLIDSISVFLFDNCLPMIGRFVSKLPSLIATGLKDIAKRMRESALNGSGEFITTLAGSLPELASALADLLSAAVDWIKNNGPTIVQMGKDALTAFIDGLKEAWPEASETIDTLLPVLEQLPKLIAGWKIGKLVTGAFSPMIEAFTSAGGGLAGLKAAFVAIGGPAAVAVGAIGTLAIAFVDLWENNEDFRNKITETWNGLVTKIQEFCQGIVDRINKLGFDFEDISEVISAAWQGLCDFLAPIFETAWSAISTTIGTALDAILATVDIFSGLFSGNWDLFWQGVQTLFDTCWNGMKTLIENVITGITEAVSVFLSWFGINWSANLDSIKMTWDNIWNGIKTFLDSIISAIQLAVGAFVSLFQGDWDGFCNGLKQAWDELWNGIKTFAGTLWDSIKSLATEWFGKIKKAITDKWDEIKRNLKGGWDTLKTNLEKAWNGIKDKATEIFNNIKDAICKPFEEAKNFVSGIWDWLTGHNEVDVKVNDETGKGKKKASENAAGGIFRSATFFPDYAGASGGNIVGEAGAEAVLPLSGFYKSLDNSIQSGMNAPDPKIDRVIELLEALLLKSGDVYLNKSALIGEIASDIEDYNRQRSRRLSFVGGTR